ncbi:hypothetical protein Tco_1229233 [Tanacetum coccineum]
MMDWLSSVETDKVIHTVETDIVKLVVEIESFGMSTYDFDKETVSIDEVQLKQADLSYVHALNELHLHEIRVVLNKHEVDQYKLCASSNLVREVHEKQSMNKSRQRFWELAGSKLGNILGVEKSVEQTLHHDLVTIMESKCDTLMVLTTKFEKIKAYIQVTQEDKEDNMLMEDEEVMSLGILDYGVDGMKSNTSTIGVSKIGVVDVYDGRFNFIERDGSTNFNKLVEMYNGTYEDNKVKDDVCVVCDKFDIWNWPKRKTIIGTKCNLKYGRWKFNIWKWPKRKRKGMP